MTRAKIRRGAHQTLGFASVTVRSQSAKLLSL